LTADAAFAHGAPVSKGKKKDRGDKADGAASEAAGSAIDAAGAGPVGPGPETDLADMDPEAARLLKQAEHALAVSSAVLKGLSTNQAEPPEPRRISTAPLPLVDLTEAFLGPFFELCFPDKKLIELCRELRITTPGYRLEALPPDQVARVLADEYLAAEDVRPALEAAVRKAIEAPAQEAETLTAEGVDELIDLIHSSARGDPLQQMARVTWRALLDKSAKRMELVQITIEDGIQLLDAIEQPAAAKKEKAAPGAKEAREALKQADRAEKDRLAMKEQLSAARTEIAARDLKLAEQRAERAAGRDAEREAGELSMDQVRAHLVTSVLPRLASEGVVDLPPADLLHPAARVRVAPRFWAELSAARTEVENALRSTGDHAATREQRPAPLVRAAEQGGSVLEARGLSKVYRRRRVVNDVALRLQQGEIVGLLGPNGAGKTTTFYMIVGLIQPLTGQIMMDGVDITSMPMYQRSRKGIGYLSQEPSIFRKLSVEENIVAILETLPLSREQRAARLEQLLGELSIEHLRRSKAYQLSGGERRRLEITRALVTEPKFMMLDEPFAGVDPIAVHDIQTIVANLRTRGIGVLISDHNVEQTLDIVDRAYIMFDGEVKVAGTVRELVFDDLVADRYLGPTLSARLRARFEQEMQGDVV